MGSVSFAKAEQLSFCGAAVPSVDGWTTDQFRRFLQIREIETECEKTAHVTATDKPTVNFIASGGTPNTTPVTWQAGTDNSLKRLESLIDASGDILSQMRAAIDVEIRLQSAVIEQRFFQSFWLTSSLPNGPPTMASAGAANPNGEINVGGLYAIQPKHLACLRAKITPWSPDSALVYVMHSTTLAALEETARQQGTPLDYRPDPAMGGEYPYYYPFYGPFRILACDHISLQETTGPNTTSAYLVRVGEGPSDPVGTYPVTMLVPRGRAGVQVSGFFPLENGTDTWRNCTSLDGTLALPPGSVARAKGILSS